MVKRFLGILIGFILIGTGVVLADEDIQLTTYYPAPDVAYNTVQATGSGTANTSNLAAGANQQVLVGTNTPRPTNESVKLYISQDLLTRKGGGVVAKEAIRQGAYEYLCKPFDLSYLKDNLLARIFMS